MTDATLPLRILIVDDHPMVADGIRALLETYDDLTVVGTLSNGREAIARTADLRPDVILLDLNMPEMNGLAATEILRERHPDVAVLILSMHDAPEYVATALRHGAAGYCLKDQPTEEIRRAIDTVVAGERYLCPGAETALEPSGDGSEPLTSREQTILLLLAQGRSNKQVAADLDISVRTVETHRKNLKRKLGISSTAGLTRYAMEHGVLQGTGFLH
ncbi:MAG: response regulator transcription factor [Jannaschia helgolandensis]|jgi:two-component system, NarL family, nitrate/nitrite response regulator NarL|uniref:Two component transcriptional regulator, LuxR family n=1 Tax=Jannaschia helgolandensis TaxID=188906 RepID=A0A1H7Q3C0_9RHOB|nr:response regulator transcription factor [Jannaschia helgolandensis]SEL42473.1 two component transcriptional regulator, LuxR family [Jannaschia helgolandensis]|tara:strand:+ start:1991 stop:2641 length:651 start_codon:yes stop_codon:yes gene_type:complete